MKNYKSKPTGDPHEKEFGSEMEDLEEEQETTAILANPDVEDVESKADDIEQEDVVL